MALLEAAERHNVEIYKGEGEAPKLIETLERLPGVKFSMCSVLNINNTNRGDPNMPFLIFLNIKNFYSLSIIARAFDRRYSGTHHVYQVVIETSDAESSNGTWPTFKLMISSSKPYRSEEKFNEDMKQLKDNIFYWQKEDFDKHFFKGKFNITL